MDLCVERHEGLKDAFTLPNGGSMTVDDLIGKDEAGWEAFVKREGGPHGLVSAWLVKNDLRRFLDGYVSPSIT